MLLLCGICTIRIPNVRNNKVVEHKSHMEFYPVPYYNSIIIPLKYHSFPTSSRSYLISLNLNESNRRCMCYDIQAKLEAQLKRARRLNQAEVIRELETELEPYITNWHHVSGFTHPNLIIYTNETPDLPTIASWGLIPDWVKNENQANDLRRKTINARGESIFEKPSFRKSAQYHRCLICIDGFYEHHHKHGKTFPFFIQFENGEPITIAGLWSNWTNMQTGEILKTFSIVTVKANSFMAEIHNTPKLNEPRMPLILSDKNADNWISALSKSNDMDRIKSLIKPSKINLVAHTVRLLRGKHSIGNSPKASEIFHYKDFNKLF